MGTKTTDLATALGSERLAVLAVAAPDPEFCPADARSLALVGPRDGSWWPHVTRAPEWRDGTPDPLDRWSKRVLGAFAVDFHGAALFPSDGPPWPPFFRWALGSESVWQSPVGMLVHAQAGLWISFRGALALPFAIRLQHSDNPCLACAAQPCRTACPVNALSATNYDITECHRWLDTSPGAACLELGCVARRACPAGQSHARLPEQSAYHMSRFHP